MTRTVGWRGVGRSQRLRAGTHLRPSGPLAASARRSGRFCRDALLEAGIRTDEHGQATVEFGLNDAVTSFRVFGDAFGDNGASASNRWPSSRSRRSISNRNSPWRSPRAT